MLLGIRKCLSLQPSPMSGGSQSGPSAQFELRNFGSNVNVEQIVDFLGFGDTDESRSSCSVALSACKQFAIVMVPDEFSFRVTERNGEELGGGNVTVQEISPKTSAASKSSTTQDLQTTQGPQPPSASEELSTLANIAAATSPLGDPHDENMATADADDHVVKSVSVDTTRCNDPFNVPTHAMVVFALGRQFPKALDPDRVVIRLSGRQEGFWRIETNQTNLYEGTQFLVHEGRQIGFIEVKHEIYRRNVVNGTMRREKVRTPRSQGPRNPDADDRGDDELLITLSEANTERFSFVTNAMLLRAIVEMGVGELKKSPQPQRHKGTDELNGNKFFVLKNITVENAKQIPSHFTFIDERIGAHRMWLNHRLKKRFCSFCNEEHEAECPTRALYLQLCAERKRMKEASGNTFNVHIVSDSTLRYAEQECLATDIHAMSGATTGNILNAIGVDSDRKDVKNLIIVAGQNELHAPLADEEFLVCLKKKEERLRTLTTDKAVAILLPPPQKRLDPMEQAKEAVLHEHLNVLDEEIPNLKVWTNPLESFEEDAGRHPDPEQTKTILNFIDQKAKEDFGISILLDSGPNDLMTTKRKYKGVKALYKYGCGACSDKSRNKWWTICSNCFAAAENPDDDIQAALSILHAKRDEIRDRESPPLASALSSSPDYRDRSPIREVDPSGNGEYTSLPRKRVKFCQNVADEGN